MFSQVLHRFLHTCSSLKAVEKAALLELRKKTGYTFTNCKKALEATDNDVKKAEKWLVKEAKKHGWASMGRSGTQGLVAVHVEGPFAAMAEVSRICNWHSRSFPKAWHCESAIALLNSGGFRFLPV